MYSHSIGGWFLRGNWKEGCHRIWPFRTPSPCGRYLGTKLKKILRFNNWNSKKRRRTSDIYLFQFTISKIPSFNTSISTSWEKFRICSNGIFRYDQSLNSVVVRRLEMKKRRNDSTGWRNFEYLYVMILWASRNEIGIIRSLPGSHAHNSSLMSAN